MRAHWGVQLELPSFLNSHFMEMSGQCQISVALSTEQELSVPIGQEGVWVPETFRKI